MAAAPDSARLKSRRTEEGILEVMERWPLPIAALASSACLGPVRVQTDPVVVRFALAGPAGRADGEPIYCDLLPASTVATVNGLTPVETILGGVTEANSPATCIRPEFRFSLSALRSSPGAPDVDLIIADGSYTIRMVVPDFAATRAVVRVTDAAAATPGAKVHYQWQPSTDQYWSGDGSLLPPGGGVIKLSGAMEAGDLVLELPISGWPVDTILDVRASAISRPSVCEGAKSCQSLQFVREDGLTLPAR
jgi:hypothetical protein